MKKFLAVPLAVVALSAAACGQADLHGAPNVKGLSLPTAKQQLQKAGYTASVTTDALFGVIIPDHYTVCSESSPDGKLVPIHVNKGC